MKRVRTIASWSVDVFLWILIMAILLIPIALLITACWIPVAWILERPTLGFWEMSTRVWGSLIFLAAIAIIIFFLYFRLGDKAHKIKWWRVWRKGLRLIQNKVRKRG